MTIEEIQKWEKSFVVKKGIAVDEKKASFIAVCKLMEESGEMAKDLLEGKWSDIQAEVADIIVFACKVANIAEDFHGTESLTKVMEKKLGYCESRTYNTETNKLDKPAHKEFK